MITNTLPRWAALVSVSLVAQVATAQIKPRVILMVDTSGSMTERINNNVDTGGGGFAGGGYKDGSGFVRTAASNPGFGYGQGFSLTACSPPNPNDFQGDFSRMAAAKGAVTNVINASGDIDWGLMRYAGTYCTPVATALGGFACTANNQCAGGQTCAPNATATLRRCTCATDNDCRSQEFCITGKCMRPDSLCHDGNYAMSDTRLGAIAGTNPPIVNRNCANRYSIPGTYIGSTCPDTDRVPAGDVACKTVESCWGQATDCNGSVARCTATPNVGAKSCQCTVDADCDTNYTCQDHDGNAATAKRCVYNLGCLPAVNGAVIEVDPAAGNSLRVLPWVNGFEDYTASASPFFVNDPELAPDGNTPLAGAARAAAAWYHAIKTANSDPKILCRPYVLVQITDGADTCDGPFNNMAPTPEYTYGPPAGARSFVNETVAGAINPNKVYVIGLSIASAADQNRLNATAAAGGTGAARFATSQADIQAALADIVASSVLVEKCNNADDDCNGACDEPFPNVAVTNAACNNPRPATVCNNGALAGTKCFATGTFVCSADTLSQVCSAATCATNPALCATAETCNGTDDDCNGVIDDCTPFVAGSCCTGSCPACNPTGVPQPETCNGCDDDCDGIADNHLIDLNFACGSNVGICTPGATQCCQEASPSVGSCTVDTVTTKAGHTNNDRLVCLGGVGPAAQVCNGLDNDCDGNKDTASQACFPFGSGTPGVGICIAGSQQCNATPIAPGAPGCPGPKPCAVGASFGACVGQSGPQAELCNNIDDNCDGTKDNNVTDAWVGQPCCPTGNNADCTNTGGSTRCKLGAYACSGGAQVCSGAVVKTAELCDGVDNDCNGVVDDVVGKGAPCSDATVITKGECTAKYTCNGTAGPGPNGLTCMQDIGPLPETCNLKDDDCNGTIDDNLNDPRLGVAGGAPCAALMPVDSMHPFPSTGPAPPCDPGITVCTNGTVTCQGRVGPSPNLCDGISRDCTGMSNSNGNCPTGFQCFQGNCLSQCAAGEFPCPGGFVCVSGLCVPDGCTKLNCKPGEICKVDNQGNATCVDPCAGITCPDGFKCQTGLCVDASCRTQGCPNAGDVCVGTPPTCQPDPCKALTCPSEQYCVGGACVPVCAGICPPGDECVAGVCVTDPCAKLHCAVGQVCTVSSGVGSCVENLCSTGCADKQACCGGQCVTDACTTVECPGGSICELTSACNARCVVPPAAAVDQIVPAGGGGVACDVVIGGRAELNGRGLWLWVGLMSLAYALLRRARAKGMR